MITFVKSETKTSMVNGEWSIVNQFARIQVVNR